MWKEVLLCVCGVTAYVMAAPSVPARQIHRVKRADPAPAMQTHRAKRAVPPAVASFVADAAEDVGGKVVDALGDRIAEGVVENHQEKVVSALEDYFSGQFDKADEEFDKVLARGGDLLSSVGGDVEETLSYRDDDEDDSSDGMSPALFPVGAGPLLMNGCFGSNYAKGGPCYEGFVPIEACANIIDGATFLGTGFDGRGEYSTQSRKKSLIQRACNGLQGYKEFHVPDTMTVQGIYDTDMESYTFSSLEEYRSYLEDKSAVTSAKSIFQQEMDKAQGHLAGGGAFGLIWSAGGENFILRWGTHYITSAKFGRQLKIIKTREASVTDSQESFAKAAQSDFHKLFSTYSAQQTQTKSSSFWHDSESTEESSSSSGQGNSETSSEDALSEKAALSQTQYSNEVMEVQGGDQKIAAAITEFYTTSFGNSLKDWLESIEEFPKAFEFRMLPITDLLDMNYDSFFPHGVVDFGCFGRKTLSEDEVGRKYYVEDTTDGNVTTSEIRYCDFEEKDDLTRALTERRLALKRAIAVYLEEGPFLTSDFQIPAGKPGCETAELAVLEESTAGAPSWQEMMSGQEFKVVFNMPYNIPHLLTARAVLNLKYRSKSHSWLTIRPGSTPNEFDAHKNGDSGDITQHKVSVGGLVMTYDENTGTFTVTQDDFDASSAVIQNLPAWVNGMVVARAEYKSLLEQLSHQQSSTKGQMPCNLQWSNALRIDPTDGGKCIHFTAASKGDIFVVFSGVPEDHETWVTVEISTSGVAVYKALRLEVTQVDKGSKGLGSDMLYQSYFVCVEEDLEESTTTVQFGKTPDNEDRGHVWLDYQFPDVLSLHFYAFGSGEHAVKMMGVSQAFKPSDLNIVCREGTVKEGGRCVQVCHAECVGCRTTGSDSPRDCVTCQNLRVPYPYLAGSVGDFECVSACPSNMDQATGSNDCQCIKRMEDPADDGTVTCVTSCPLTHFDDNDVCKRCSSLCTDVSGDGQAVCTGPAAEQCTACVYTATDGSCLEGCSPGQKAVTGSTTGSSTTSETCGLASFRHVPQTGCTGSTISSPTGVTLEGCAEACCADETCLSFQYSVHNICHLKSKICSDEEKTSASAGNMYDRINLPVKPPADNTPSGESDTITCEACRDGYKCVNGDEVEEICPAGTISRADGTACDPCAAGEFSGAAGSTACQQCPAGQFNTQSGSSSCQPCPAGKYSSSTGSTECQVCPAGRYSSSGSSACTSCPAGRYSASSGSSSCQSCPAGQYSSSSGSTSCKSCPAGKYNTREGSTRCQSCLAGKYNTREGSTSCQFCPAGQYSSSIGSTGCQVCQAGSTSSVGATMCTAVYSHLGCFRQSDGNNNAMNSMEGHFGTGYQSRDRAILRCYTVAKEAGYNLFALEDGGMCRAANDQTGRYRSLGFSQNCGNDGKGGDNAIDVYLITGKATWLPKRGSWIVTETYSQPTGETAELAIDYAFGTRWNAPVAVPARRYYNNWFFSMDLTVPHTLTRIMVQNYGDTTHDIKVFKLQKSQGRSPYNWEDVKSVSNVQAGTPIAQVFSSFQGTARYWKFLVTQTHSGYQPWLRELDFYGFPSGKLKVRTSVLIRNRPRARPYHARTLTPEAAG
uniref:MACPF domain-containing protein n=1 Tax=Branchiostoma floridae TaxID=7739 RepID=C3ZMB3_BRAFL|eukprot:XP_002590358.1 hypothetical protein BRAFLDRAFT_76619 [Branchiostoma floridae]